MSVPTTTIALLANSIELTAGGTAGTRKSTGNSVVPLVIGIAAGVGGSSDLGELVGSLNPRFSGCLAIVQHLPSGFAHSFAAYLQSLTALRVVIAEASVSVAPGLIVLATDDRHLVSDGQDALCSRDGERVLGHRPAADVLFRSLADTWAGRAVGVVLSGAGRDGSAGLLAMRARGGVTMVQSTDSAVLNHMPRAALERGAALRALRPKDISHLLQGTAAERRALQERPSAPP
ncbi:MAG TPA: chemotaxis protein CheB [Polyangiaceae bacterium]